MEFHKYQHIERLGTSATEGILDGKVYVFSKLDGTNTGVFIGDNKNIVVNSRNRVLSLDKDNQGCFAYVLSQDKFKKYLDKHPNHYLYGEYLIRNYIKYYEDDAWRKVYIFDVVEYDEHGNYRYLPYEEYVPYLEEFDIPYIPVIKILDYPTIEDIESLKTQCTFLTKDNQAGEGLVCKRYDFKNKFGEIVWAKRVIEKFVETKKIPREPLCIEDTIINKFITQEYIEKEYNKFIVDKEWESKLIPQFLESFWRTFITEEIYNILKKFKTPKIDFKVLRKCFIDKVKSYKSELFS